MIEYVTYRGPSDTRDAGDNADDRAMPPYFELRGETRPHLCTEPVKVLAPDTPGDTPQTTSTTIVYEYVWTVHLPAFEHRGRPQDGGAFLAHLPPHEHYIAEVRVCFPRAGGWRACEVVATVDALKPFAHGNNLTERVADYWKTVAPVLATAGDLATLVPNPVGAGAGALLPLIAKMHITGLPPVQGYEWYVRRATQRIGEADFDSVHWALPLSLFRDLGGRLTGSILVYFLPAHEQHGDPRRDPSAYDPHAYDAQPIAAQAIIHGTSGHQHLLLPDAYLQLQVKPCVHAIAAPATPTA